MEFKDALYARKSIRAFTDKPVTREDIEAIATLAQRVPTWADSQPYKVYVAIGEKAAAIRAEHEQTTLAEVPSSPTWESLPRMEWQAKPRDNMVNWSAAFHKHLNEEMEISKSTNRKLFNAQALVYLALPKNSKMWSAYDLGSFGTTMMFAAADRGIDSMAAYEFIMYPERLREVLNVDPEFDVVMGFGLGYRDPEAIINAMPQIREPMEAFLTIEE